MQELQVANDALGNNQALDRILKERGYWFFRDVLDRQALGVVRDRYMAELFKLGVVDADTSEPIWNLAPTDGLGDGLDVSKVPALREHHVWETFVADRKINAFIESVIGGPAEWLTASDFYRIVPPGQPLPETPYKGRHQDGFGLPGLEFLTCWIPIADADADVGGLAVAAGSFANGVFQPRWFDDDMVPEASWSRADYRFGDILMFVPTMLHSGLANASNRFRLSLDIRVLRPASQRPIYGTVTSIDTDQVTIRDQAGDDISLAFTETTHLRGMVAGNDIPILIKRAEVPHYLPPGTKVMSTRDGGQALLLRPHQY